MSNTITLFCLVLGEPASNAFPVEIDKNKTIGDLKELIKEKKTPNFDECRCQKSSCSGRSTFP